MTLPRPDYRSADEYQGRHELPTSEKVKVLVAALPARCRAAVVVAAGTGLRQGEVFGLTVDRIDFLRGLLTVDRQLLTVAGERPKLGPLKTIASVRTVPLSPDVLEALDAHLVAFPATGDPKLVFTNPTGSPVRRDTFHELWVRTVKYSGGRPIRFHDLHHFHTSRLIRQGESEPRSWLFEEFVRSLSDLAPHSVEAYRSDIEHFIAWVLQDGIKDVAEIDHRVVRRYIANLRAQGYADATTARKVSAVRRYLRWLRRRRQIPGPDPTRRVNLPSGRMGRVPHIVDPDVLGDLLNPPPAPPEREAVRQRDLTVIGLLYDGGLRVSELCGLNVGDVDLQTGLVRVLGKGDKERLVPIAKPSVEAVATWLGTTRATWERAGSTPLTDRTPLFLNHRGRRLGDRDVRRMLEDRGLHPHQLRHTTATDLLEGGMDLRLIAEFLGHSTVTTTQIYTHISKRLIVKVHADTHPRA